MSSVLGVLRLELERRPRARNRCALGLGGRHQRQRLLGAGKVAGLDVALGETRERLRVLGSPCRISPNVCAAVLRSPAASAASAASRLAAASPLVSPISRAMKALTRDSGSAPMKPSTGLPSWKANTAGIDCTAIWPGICGCSSILSLTSLMAPFAARTAFSRIGVSWRQGPHQGAQKSTTTGTSREASMTSRMKSLVVVFLISSASGVPVPPCFRMGVSTLMLLARRRYPKS